MPPGVNSGGQLNVLIFEVGMRRRDPDTDVETVTSLALHPLFVVPSLVQYRDSSRTSVGQTIGGAVRTVGGRQLLAVHLEGVWGVESRGAGPIIGTGEVRFQRFWKEVVRLGDALLRRDVDAAIDVLRSSPLLGTRLAAFNVESCSFFINFYDLWNGQQFECQIGQFNHQRSATNGGASGLVHYTLDFGEVGPIVTTGISSALVRPLLRGLAIWGALNDTIKSYNPETLVLAVAGLPSPFLTQLTVSLDAVAATVDSATAVMGIAPQTAPSGALAAYLGNALGVVGAARQLAAAFPRDEATTANGEVNWGRPRDPVLDTYDAREDLLDVEDAAAFQGAAGALFGQDRDEYRSYLTSSAAAGGAGPRVAGAVRYTVRDTDTEDTIVARFGVAWSEILATNGLFPDEALMRGTVLQIPTLRVTGPRPIDGLPTFGSQVGRAAWGTDITVDLAVDDTGRPVVLANEDVLEQGLAILTAEFGDGLLEDIDGVPAAGRDHFLDQRIRAMLATDPRIMSFQSIEIRGTGTGYDIAVVATAINGEEIRTGGGPTA